MAASLSYSTTSDSPELSPKVAIHDIAALLNTSQLSAMRRGLLFMSTPLYLATHEDRAVLRDELKTKTILSSLHTTQPRYTRGQESGSYITEQYVVEEFLGLRTFHIYPRYCDEFIRNAINELPLWSRL